jgi:hypothetical protein
LGRGKIWAEAALQEECGYSDGGDYDQGDGAEECFAAGVEDD